MNKGENTNYNFLKRFTSSDMQDDEFRNCVIKYSITTVVFVIVCIVLYNIISNPGRANYNVEKYFFLYMFPLLMIFAILLNISSNQTNRRPFLEIFGAFVVFAIVIYYYTLSTGVNVDLSGTTNILLIIAIALVGLAILYNVLVAYLSRLKGWPGFVAELIFYLPCVLYDFWLYLLEQFQLTPIAIYGFIFIEIILILLYIYLPSLSKYIVGTDNSLLLVKNVIPLNKGKQVIATSSMLKQKPSPDQIQMGLEEPFYLRNYAISFWVFVNNQTPSNYNYSRESQILNYGYVDKDNLYQVKPMITYYGGGNISDQPTERNKFVFYFVNYKDLELENEIESMNKKITQNIAVTQEKINNYNTLLNSTELSDTEITDMQNIMKGLEAYKNKLTNTQKMNTVSQQIAQLKTAIKNKNLTPNQRRDLKNSLKSSNNELEMLQNDDFFVKEQLDFLNKEEYDTMKYTFYPVSMESQKWNQIVLNYSDNKVDLCINGNLERTFYLAGENIPNPEVTRQDGIYNFIPKYSDLDTITIGDEFGIDGGICNVEYFKQPLTPEQISFNYNIYADKNPPIPRREKDKNNLQ